MLQILKDRISSKDGLCGVNIFSTTEDDPFIECCRAHDSAYDLLPYNQSTKEADKLFFKCCRKVAKTDKLLRLRAQVYYRLARNYGRMRYMLGKLGILKNERTTQD